MGAKAEYKDLTDIQLVELLKSDYEDAFNEILKRYSAILINFTYRRVEDLPLSEDLVSDLWADIWAKRKTIFLEGTIIAPFLFTALKNRILDHFKRQKVAKKYIDNFRSFLLTEENNSDYLVRHHDLSALIEREIAALPENMRIVFELNRNQNMSRKEIADLLCMPENSVKSNMQRALKVLRTRLGDSLALFLF